ncbi:MAG: phage major capsid protein, partial [Ahrensia sp.]
MKKTTKPSGAPCAPERKNTPIAAQPNSHAQDVAEAFDDFMSAFEGFKQANDERLRQLESTLGEDPLTADKVDRINQAVDEQKRVLDRLISRQHRPGLSGKSMRDFGHGNEHKTAFSRYIRKGDEQGLRAMESKAMSYASGPDGGFLVPDETEAIIGKRLASLSPIRAISAVRQVSGAVLKKPFAITGPSVGWVGET